MKNLKKTLAVVTAIVAMLVSSSAFAEVQTSFTGVSGIDNPVCEGIETGAPEVTVTVNAASSDEMTFIILNDGANEEDVQEEDILYIDQHAVSEGKSFTGIINPDRASEGAETLPDGDYVIKVGYQPASGNFTIARATLHVETKSSGRTIKFVFGDVNGGVYAGAQTTVDESVVTATDALDLLKYLAGGSSDRGGAFAIGTIVSALVKD